MKEMRSEKRFPTFFQTDILTSDSNKLFAFVLDVSSKGLRLTADDPIENGELELQFENDHVVTTCRGQVVWTQEKEGRYYYGIKLMSSVFHPNRYIPEAPLREMAVALA